MKVVAIGDIHGRTIWKDIVATNSDADYFVFIGDYWDSFSVPYLNQLSNFKEIVEFKKSNTDKVILLLANHDFHYLRGTKNYTGHQGIHQWDIQEILEPLVLDGTIQMAWSYNNYLFTHAGVTKQWCENNNIDINNIVDELNYCIKRYRNIFEFTGTDPYGDDIQQTPIWIRPNSLTKDALDNWIQIVGHTSSDNIKYYPFTIGYNVVTIDTLCTGKYMIIEDNKIIEKQIIENLPLIEYGGFELTNVIIAGDEFYICEWYTVEDNVNKYFLFNIAKRYLKPYLKGKLSHLDLIRHGKLYHMYDDTVEFNFENILKTTPIRFKQLPQKSLPLKNVFILKDICNYNTLKKLEWIVMQ